MPKRNNPFGDHSCLQLKTHIGAKEVNEGVDSQNKMKSVYEKTKKLLFDGVQKEMGSECNNNSLSWKFHEDKVVSKSDNLKQTHLNKYCQIVKEEDSEMDIDDGNKVESHGAFQINSFFQGFASSSSFHKNNPCQTFPFPSKQIDLRFSQRDCKMNEFVPASSFMMTNFPKPPPTMGNVFEQLKQAQAAMSRSDRIPGACHSCRQPVHTRDVIKCQFCENYVCGKCSRQCSGCCLHFCPLCSILNYSEATERAFCFTCSGR